MLIDSHCRQSVVEYDSISGRTYVVGSSMKQYSQDFQTVAMHNDLHEYSQVRLSPADLLLDLATCVTLTFLNRHLEVVVGSWSWM